MRPIAPNPGHPITMAGKEKRSTGMSRRSREAADRYLEPLTINMAKSEKQNRTKQPTTRTGRQI